MNGTKPILKMTSRFKSINDRLDNYGLPVPECGCILWTAYCSDDGYGIIYTGNGLDKAHRASWVRHFGPIPKGMHVLHKCDVSSCINPNHLFLGTNKDNVDDRVKKRRSASNCGAKNGRAKLTNKDIENIRLDNRSNKKIAKDYSVTDVLIGLIKKREIWKHI